MSATAVATRDEVQTLADELEALWQCLDELFGAMSPTDWDRKHGKHWTFADLPYHLAYLDRECTRVMAQGAEAPPSARWLMHSEAEIIAWNAGIFARRPVGQTAAESLAQMQASRELIRRTLDGLTDADLERPAWSPFFGWTRREIGKSRCAKNHVRTAIAGIATAE